MSKQVFSDIEKFARYGFAKIHSMAYSALSYTTAYLKCHYPLEYMCAILNANFDNSDDMQLSLIGSAESPVIEKLKDTDINTLTPIEAMNLLYELKGMI